MAKISLILFVTVLTVPSVLMGKVSNQTQRLHSTGNNDLKFTTTDCPGSSDNDKRKEFLKYFIRGQMPSGLFKSNDPNVLYLCQTHPPSNPVRSYYSTIFDKTTMNAVLSAYGVTHESALLIGENSERVDDWTSKHENNLFLKTHYDALYSIGKNDGNYQKGHLLPFSIYSFDENYGESTFDYSNAVPQRAEWDQGDWKSFEKAIKRYTQLTCGCRYRGTMYLLTGTSQFAYHISKSKLEQEQEFYRPNKKITDTTNTRSIKIPNVMWTAGCCIWSDLQNGQEKVESIAVIGNNLPSHTLTTAIRVRQLQLVLADPQAQNPVILFPGRPACSAPGNSYILKVKSK